MGCRAVFFILLLSAVLAPGAAAGDPAAEDPHAVQPERPTVATHAHTVAPGWVEIEGGLERDRLDDTSYALIGTLVTKIGLTPHMQWNLNAPWERLVGTAPAGSAYGDVSSGLKWRLLDRAPLLGDFALLPSLKLSTGSPSRCTGTGTRDASLALISSHAIGAFAVDINLGYTRRDGQGIQAPRDATLWTVSAGLPSLGWWSGVAELYGLPGTTGPAGAAPIVALLLGPTALPRPWLELDAGMIVPVSGAQPRALFCGCVWNVGRL